MTLVYDAKFLYLNRTVPNRIVINTQAIKFKANIC